MVRSYPVPASMSSTLLGPTATMDDIDRLIESGAGSATERLWATRVRGDFVSRILDDVMGDDNRLPMGIIASVTDDTDIVVALTRGDKVWTADGWVAADHSIVFDDVIALTQEEVAFTADALRGGAVGLALRAVSPIAFMDKNVVLAAAAPPPPGSKVVAVVDEIDKAAVLDLLAIAPGPHIFRRHDGQWLSDDDWLRELRSIKPPALVQVDDQAKIDEIVAQIDEATKGNEFEKSSSLRGSALDDRSAEMWLEWTLLGGSALVASRMPNNLQKYWLTGRGAAKIRWGTPGAWRRCYRQLSKYMNPYMARGSCTNLSEKLGGHGVATHVGG